MNPNWLIRIFEWFTSLELILARVVIFALFLIGLWTVFQWSHASKYLNAVSGTTAQTADVIQQPKSRPQTERRRREKKLAQGVNPGKNK